MVELWPKYDMGAQQGKESRPGGGGITAKSGKPSRGSRGKDLLRVSVPSANVFTEHNGKKQYFSF